MKSNALVLLLCVATTGILAQHEPLLGDFRSTDGLYTFSVENSDGQLEGWIHDARLDHPHPTTIRALGDGRYDGTARISGYNYYWTGMLVEESLSIVMSNYTYTFTRLNEETQTATATIPAYGLPPKTTVQIAGMDAEEMVRRLTGAKITSYTSSSIFSSGSASNLKETHLCPEGRLFQDSEGSFYVEGDIPDGRTAGDAAAGAHQYRNAGGEWYIGDHQGQPSLVLKFRDGSWGAHPLAQVAQLSWRWAQTKYAMELNKARCPKNE
ncbi:MAG: hypothetical protein AAGA85_14965 [Bacteroidota bacterium]